MSKYPITPSIAADIRAFVLTEMTLGDAIIGGGSFSFGQNYGSLALSEEESKRYAKLLARMKGFKSIGERRNHTRIAKHVSELISAHLQGKYPSDADLESAIDRAIDELSAPLAPRTVFVPVVGISLKIKTLSFGNITLSPYSKLWLDAQRKRMKQMMKRQKHHKLIIEREVKSIRESFENASIAKIEIDADGERSIELAHENIANALDLLASAFPCIHGLRRVFIEVGPPATVNSFYMISKNDDNLNYQCRVVRPDDSVVIDKAKLQKLNRLGFATLGTLAHAAKSETEIKIARAAKWLGRSLRMSGTTERFLMAVNALESLFSRGRGAPVIQNIAEGAAFVKGRTSKDRLAVCKHIRELYGKRSTLVHGGDDKILDVDAATIQLYVYEILCLCFLNISKLNNLKNGIEDWVERQKFGDKYNLRWPKRSKE